MPGNAIGGHRAAETNKKRYGKDFYARIGKKGGELGTTGGFAAGEEGRARARKYGAIGGRISRRRKSETEATASEIQGIEATNVENATQKDFDLAA